MRYSNVINEKDVDFPNKRRKNADTATNNPHFAPTCYRKSAMLFFHISLRDMYVHTQIFRPVYGRQWSPTRTNVNMVVT